MAFHSSSALTTWYKYYLFETCDTCVLKKINQVSSNNVSTHQLKLLKTTATKITSNIQHWSINTTSIINYRKETLFTVRKKSTAMHTKQCEAKNVRQIITDQHTAVRTIYKSCFNLVQFCIGPVQSVFKSVNSKTIWPDQRRVNDNCSVCSIKCCTFYLCLNSPVSPVHTSAQQKHQHQYYSIHLIKDFCNHQHLILKIS